MTRDIHDPLCPHPIYVHGSHQHDPSVCASCAALAKARAEERERAAAICERMRDQHDDIAVAYRAQASACARAIRAGGEWALDLPASATIDTPAPPAPAPKGDHA